MKLTKETIADLTPEEFLTKYEQYNELVQAELKIAQELAEDETYNFTSGVEFWDRKSHRSDSIFDADMDEVIDAITNFKEETRPLQSLRGFRVENKDEIFGDCGDSYAEIDYIGFEATWITPKEEVSQGAIDTEFKRIVRLWLAPEGISTYDIQYIDCKLLTLFKEGKIDWGTLRTLVYSNCDV